MQTQKSLAAQAVEVWASEVGQEAVARALGRSQEMVSRYAAGTHTPGDYRVRRRAFVARGIALDAWEQYPVAKGAKDGARREEPQEDRASRDRVISGGSR